MLLAPQHFQHQSRRFEALLYRHARLASPFFWGVSRLEIDQGRLGSKQLALRSLEAILSDGLFVDELPAPLDLTPWQSQAQVRPVRIYLSVPGAAVAERQGAMARFVAAGGAPVSDSDPEAEEQYPAVVVPVLRPNVRLATREELRPGEISLPVAEVTFGSAGFVTTNYTPPLLKVGRAPHARGIVDTCQRVVNTVRDKAAFLIQIIGTSRGRDATAQFRRQLDSLMTALPEFQLRLESGECHPFDLFLALTTLSAHVAAVSTVIELPRPARYDHEELFEIFDGMASGISAMLDLSIQENYTEHALAGIGHVFTVPFEEDWARQELVLGFLGSRPDEVQAWAEGCYIGTDSSLADMNRNRDTGARRRSADQLERLNRRAGTLLYVLAPELRCIKPGETLFVYNPVKRADDPGPTHVLLYVKKADR